MKVSPQLLAYAGIALIGLALILAGVSLALTPPTESPSLGLRGLKRQRALAQGGLFATFEPLMRFVAGLCRTCRWAACAAASTPT